jgi:hypothetical protein
MNPLPLPVRVAAGIAATALERARQLPEQLAGLPVTVASQALQLSMRVQQRVTELAIKGDEALATLRPVEDAPDWATFDEDELGSEYDVSRYTAEDYEQADPWSLETEALAEPHADGEFDTEPSEEPAEAEPAGETAVDATGSTTAEPPAAQPDYDFLSIPQLRARLRNYTIDELEELLGYEVATQARPPYVGMLTRRIATVSEQQPN